MNIQIVLVSLLLVTYTRAQTGPNFCTYNDGVFECDYASMVSPSDRPIDYTGFSQDPQQIEVTVNGFLPYFGKTLLRLFLLNLEVSQREKNVLSDRGSSPGHIAYRASILPTKLSGCLTHYLP